MVWPKRLNPSLPGSTWQSGSLNSLDFLDAPVEPGHDVEGFEMLASNH